MVDLMIALENRPGALAEMGEALGRAGVSVEGGGAFVVNGQGIAHFLVENGAAARSALQAADITVLAEREVLVQRLNQVVSGQLGKISRRMAEAGVNIEVLYSDHANRLILVVDDMAAGRAVSEAWTREQDATPRLNGTEPEEETVKRHSYEIQVDWTGNDGQGTKTYKGYRRDHTILSPGKPQIPGSSDPNFRGDAARYNPEELLVASLSACHMLWYLHLCSTNKVTVLDYCDAASGVMEERDDGSGAFTRVVLKPRVKISPGDDKTKALALHSDAHHHCFIANSVNFPVEVVAEIMEAAAPR